MDVRNKAHKRVVHEESKAERPVIGLDVLKIQVEYRLDHLSSSVGKPGPPGKVHILLGKTGICHPHFDGRPQSYADLEAEPNYPGVLPSLEARQSGREEPLTSQEDSNRHEAHIDQILSQANGGVLKMADEYQQPK